jgi:hypothetical protein
MTDKTAGGWFILETNYDHWKKPLVVDNRRDPAINCTQKMGIQVIIRGQRSLYVDIRKVNKLLPRLRPFY